MQRKASAVWQGDLKRGQGHCQRRAESSTKRNIPSAHDWD
jgi:hypothetical protein